MTKARHFDPIQTSSDPRENAVGLANLTSRVTQLKQVTIDGSDLTYAERGKGEPIVFVHGALGDYRTWSQQLDLFSEQYHAVSYSRRYHRPNAPCDDPTDYTYRRHVDDLIALIDTLRLGPAHLIGHSYGGAVATMVAIERPEMVTSLILAEPSLFSILTSSDDKVSFRFHRIALGVVQKLAENGEERLAVREYVNIVLGRDGYDDLPLEEMLLIVQNAHTLGPMLRTLFELSSFDPNRLQNLQKPTLIITGELSPKVYRAVSYELHNSLPNSELLTLAGASHGLHTENRQGFGDAVLGFLCQNKVRARVNKNAI